MELVLDYGDRRHIAACRLPAPPPQPFPATWSKQTITPKPRKPGAEQPPALVQPPPKRTLHPKKELGPIEQLWHDGKTQFPIKRDGLLTPIGSAPPLEGLGHFLSRTAEILAIAESQDKELATIRDELAANGIPVLSSSVDDDDMDEWEAIGARHVAHPDIVWTDVVSTSTIQRQIEWERYNLACGVPIRTGVQFAPDGTIAGFGAFDRFTKVSDDLIRAQVARMKASKWLAGRTPDDVLHARHIAQATGKLPRCEGHDPFPPTHDMYEEPIAEDRDGGPAELGFHGEGEEPFTINAYEPSEQALWPITEEELVRLVQQGQPLNEEELRWLARHPDVVLPPPTPQVQFQRREGRDVSVEKAADEENVAQVA